MIAAAVVLVAAFVVLVFGGRALVDSLDRWNRSRGGRGCDS